MLILWLLQMKVVFIHGVVADVGNWAIQILLQCLKMKTDVLINQSQN